MVFQNIYEINTEHRLKEQWLKFQFILKQWRPHFHCFYEQLLCYSTSQSASRRQASTHTQYFKYIQRSTCRCKKEQFVHSFSTSAYNEWQCVITFMINNCENTHTHNQAKCTWLSCSGRFHTMNNKTNIIGWVRSVKPCIHEEVVNILTCIYAHCTNHIFIKPEKL